MIRWFSCMVLIGFSNLFSNFGQAQNPYWNNFTSGNFIFGITFDGDTVWVTSQGGVSKILPGIGLLKNYNSFNSDVKSIDAYQIISDSQHRKWFTQFETGLYSLEGDVVQFRGQWAPSNYGAINTLACDTNDHIYFTTYDTGINFHGLMEFDGNNFIRTDSLNHQLPTSSLSYIFKDYSGSLIAGNLKYIYQKNSSGWDLIDSSFSEPGYPSGFISRKPNGVICNAIEWPCRIGTLTPSGWIYQDSTDLNVNYSSFSCFYADPSGNLWVAGRTRDNLNSLSKYDGVSWTTFDSLNCPAIPYFITIIRCAPNGHIWLGTDLNGVYEFDGTSWIHYATLPYPSMESYIDKVAFDAHDHAWIVARGRTIEKVDSAFTETFNYANDVAVDTSDNVWVASDYYPSTGNLPVVHRYDGSSWTDLSLLNYDRAFVASDANNVKWIAIDYVGLLKYTDSSQILYTTSNSPLATSNFFSVYCDGNGNVWIPQYGILQKFDGVNWQTYNTSGFGFPFEFTTGLTEDFSGNLYGWCYGNTHPHNIGKYDGVNWTSFIPAAPLPGLYPYSIAFDHSNNMWISFGDYGISKYDGTTWTSYTPDNSPLPGTIHPYITFDRFDNLWICGVYSGLTIFNPRGIQFTRPVTGIKKVNGSVFFDTNSNGVKDSTENGLPNQHIMVLPDSTILTTNSAGLFSRTLLPGDYQFQILPQYNWVLTTDSLVYHVHLDSNSVILPSYGLNAGPFHRASISDISGMTYCGTESPLWINYSNQGSVADSGFVTLQFDTSFDVLHSIPPPAVLTDSTALWNFSGLAPFETRTITLGILTPYASGIVMNTNASVTFLQGSQTVAFATADQSDSVNCYDEAVADLFVHPAGTGSQHFTSVHDTLSYTIRFQNTGHSVASYVSIEDTLDSALDPSTFSIVASSHTVNYSFTGNEIQFEFPAINLPDSATDPIGSQGYVTFQAACRPTTPDLTVVRNTARLSFDYTELLTTNYVFNTIRNQGSGITDAKAEAGLKVYPNPSTGTFTIELENEHPEKLILYLRDVLGKNVLVREVTGRLMNIETTGIAPGVYFLAVENKRNEILYSKKIVINQTK